MTSPPETTGAPSEPAERLHVTRSRAKPGGTAADGDGSVSLRRARKPPWLKVPAPGGPTYRRLKAEIGGEGLHTVCEEANCPNVGECWERGTATFMILGDVCTRRCGFCNVKTGAPSWNDPLEPLRVANQVKRMGLRHAVVTSVDRDDLPDYGASAFVGVIRSIRMQAPGCKVEVYALGFESAASGPLVRCNYPEARNLPQSAAAVGLAWRLTPLWGGSAKHALHQPAGLTGSGAGSSQSPKRSRQ